MNDPCNEFRDRIHEAVFGDGGAEVQNAVDAHLATCPSCRREKHLLVETAHRLRADAEMPPPRHFFVYAEDERKRVAPLRLALAAALVVVALLVGLLVAPVHLRREEGVLMVSIGDTPEERLLAPMRATIRDLEDRFDRTLAVQAADFRSELARVETGLYRTMDRQRTEDLAALGERFNLVATRHELQQRQTEALQSVMFQVIDSRDYLRRTP